MIRSISGIVFGGELALFAWQFSQLPEPRWHQAMIKR